MNRKTIQQIRTKLSLGQEIGMILMDHVPGKIKADFEVMSRMMSCQQALSLSVALAQEREKIREQSLKVILYPCVMLLVSVIGLALFNLFCFPMMISLAESFGEPVTGSLLLHRMIHVFLILLLISTLCTAGILTVAGKRIYRMSGYLLLIRKGRGEWIRRVKSLDFARYFLCCMREGCATRSTLTLMQQIENKPFLKLLSWHVEQGLLQGKSFESALKDEVLDPSLMQLMRCMSLSEDPQAMLQGYIQLRQKQITQKIRHTAVMIQCGAYMIIAMMVIVVYRILLMPLSMIAGM